MSIQPRESLLTTPEPLAVIKKEPPEFEIGIDNIVDSSHPDIKNVDIISHIIHEDSIKCETVPEDKLETKHSESAETQVFVKTENAPFIKTENVNEDFTLDPNEQLALNYAEDLNVISVKSIKSEQTEMPDFSEYYRIIYEPAVKQEDRYHCDECNYATYKNYYLKRHKLIHLKLEEVQYFYCYHCSYKSKGKSTLKNHIWKHFEKEEVAFHCYKCDFMTLKRESIIEHITKHLKVQIKSEIYEDKEIIPDVKHVDIISHILCQDSITTETVPKDIFETKHSESMDTQVFVKTENAPLIKTEELNEDFNVLNKLEIDGQYDLNFSEDLDDINISSIKSEHTEKADFAECHSNCETASWEEGNKKIKIFEAPAIPVEQHEYTSLGKGKYVCNHCQNESNKVENVKCHIRNMHREVTTIYQCPYCPLISKYKSSIRLHIIRKHKDTKHIQAALNMDFEQRPECSKHGNTKYINQHEAHTKTPKKRYRCGECDYKTYTNQNLNAHKLIHLNPEEIQYFYCYHCPFKSVRKGSLRVHIFRHFKNEDVPLHCYICDFMTLKRDLIIEHFKKHSKHHSKCDEREYNYQLETRAKRPKKSYHCNNCDFKTQRRYTFKVHKLTHLKPEEIQYFYCYHCSYKSKRKNNLKDHIWTHFKNGEVAFYCYVCDSMTLTRESIIDHIKEHSKVQIKSENN